jgi:hypothetical protein
MAFQYSATVINAKLDAIETAVGTAPSLLIFSGAEPANCAAADPAGVLATIVLPSDWMNAASSPTKTKLGTWSVAAWNGDGGELADQAGRDLSYPGQYDGHDAG